MTSFKEDEVPTDVQYLVDRESQVRCKWWNPRKHDVCNRMFFVGLPSPDPQEFKCPNCGNKTIVVRL